MAEENDQTDSPESGISEDSNSQPEVSKFDSMVDKLSGVNKEDPQPSGSKELSEDNSDDSPKNDWEKDYKELQAQKDKEVSSVRQQLLDIAIENVNARPEYLHELAQKDQKLADQVIKNHPDLKEHGLKSYQDLLELAEKQKLPEETRSVLEKEVEPLKKTVEELQNKLTEKEKAEAEAFVTKFKEENPEFTGELEEKTWEVFNKSEFTLEEAFEFAKFKAGKAEDENQRTEKAFKNLMSKNFAGSIPTGDGKSSRESTTQLSNSEVAFLRGIGAKNSLGKYGIN